MRRTAILATAGTLAFAGVAGAHGDHHGAKVYRATLVKTTAADTAQLPGVIGKAQLVDGKKRNKISIHLRGLKPGETYGWHVHKAANATDDPCAPTTPVVDGTPYGDWLYGALTANEDGNASAKATSVTFDSRADQGPFYVDVHLADKTVIACGVLKGKWHGKHGHAKPHHSVKGKDQGQGRKAGHGPEDD
jgi:hypothetical protein